MAAGATATAKRRSSRTVTSKTAWSALAIHTITLPSSAIVKIRLPDISILMAGDAVPERLRGIAIRELSKQIRDVQATALGDVVPDIQAEEIADLMGLNRWLVTQTLVEPELSEAELEAGAIPNEDFLMLTQLASRERDTDARGVRLGVEPVERWAAFKQFHGCADECEACNDAIEELSTRG